MIMKFSAIALMVLAGQAAFAAEEKKDQEQPIEQVEEHKEEVKK